MPVEILGLAIIVREIQRGVIRADKQRNSRNR